MTIFNFNDLDICYFYRTNQSSSNYYFFKNIIDNYESILKNSNEDDEIRNFNEVLQFFWILDLKSHFEEIKNEKFTQDEFDKVKEVSNILNLNYDSFYIFIENNYKDILKKADKNEIIRSYFMDKLFDFVYNSNNFKKMPKTLKYIELNYGHWILNNFDACKKYYKNNKESLKEIVNYIFEKNVNDKILIEFMMKESNKNSFGFLREFAIKIYTHFKEDCLNKNYSKMGNNLIVEKNNILKIIEFGKFYTIYKRSDFEGTLKIINNEINKLSFEEFDLLKMDINNFIKKINNRKSEFIFIYLTHIFNEKDNKFSNIFDKILKNKPSTLVRNVQNGKAVSYRTKIDLILSLLNEFYDEIFKNLQVKDDFIIYLFEISKAIEKEYFNDRIEFYDEIISICYFYEELIKKRNNQIILCGISNSLIKMCIGTIEKIIRNIYAQFSKNDNFDENKCTFYQLINSDIVKNKISPGLIKVVTFYLSISVDDDLTTNDFKGYDLRNKYMHNHDKSFKESPEYVFICFYLLVSLVTELYLRNE